MQSFLFIILLSFNMLAAQIESIKHYIQAGELKKAILMSDSIAGTVSKNSKTFQVADSLKQIALRTYIDFSVDEINMETQLAKRIGSYTQAQKTDWEKLNWLEYKIIDGQKKYFNRAAGNLKLRLKQQTDSANSHSESLDAFSKFKVSYLTQLLTVQRADSKPCAPQNYEISYTITLQPNVVPQGETIRCWMPWPKENHSRQADVKFISCNASTYQIAATKNAHRSIYIEQKTMNDKPTVFSISFSYTAFAQNFYESDMVALPYKKSSVLYKTYTREQQPHITFNSKIQKLTDELVGNEQNPLKVVAIIYDYICQHTIWSGAQEYSILECIPNYVLDNRKGDCGMQTFLFMSMARYKGIPVRWQSGWMMHPHEVNLHDWCEVYYEGTGWVPLDMSFQYMPSADKRIKNFYLTGIDAYRMIVNDDIAAKYQPRKKYFRSEPYDFQRGELEWRGGNIYFDKWDYHMDVVYK